MSGRRATPSSAGCLPAARVHVGWLLSAPRTELCPGTSTGPGRPVSRHPALPGSGALPAPAFPRAAPRSGSCHRSLRRAGSARPSTARTRGLPLLQLRDFPQKPSLEAAAGGLGGVEGSVAILVLRETFFSPFLLLSLPRAAPGRRQPAAACLRNVLPLRALTAVSQETSSLRCLTSDVSTDPWACHDVSLHPWPPLDPGTGRLPAQPLRRAHCHFPSADLGRQPGRRGSRHGRVPATVSVLRCVCLGTRKPCPGGEVLLA